MFRGWVRGLNRSRGSSCGGRHSQDDEPHRSHTSRYQQLIEDVRNDITRFEPFFASAARVIELDRKRSASLKMVS